MAFKKQVTVSVHIFSTLDNIEILKVDEKSYDIEQAASLPAEFDRASRQIPSEETFTASLKDLYEANRIPLNAPTILVLPSFFTRKINLPPEFSKEEISMALVSEAERFYMFQKHEPQIDWLRLTDGSILYTAYPKSEIEKMVSAFKAHQIPLLSIELSCFAVLRGLIATGALSQEIDNNQQWGLIIINENSFSIMTGQGSEISSFTESPLSTESEYQNEDIQAICQDFHQVNEESPVSKLVIINNAYRIPMSSLLSSLSFKGAVLSFEQSSDTLRSRGSLEAMYPCSLEALGSVFLSQMPNAPSINLLPALGQDTLILISLKQLVNKGLILLVILAILLGGLLWSGLSLVTWLKEKQFNDLSTQVSHTGQTDYGQSFKQAKRKLFVNSKLQQNIETNDFLVTVGTALPDDLWISNITVTLPQLELTNPSKGSSRTEQAKQKTISLEGGALTPEPLDQFLNSINASAKTPLEITKAELSNDSSQPYYKWEINTTTNQ